LAQALGPQPQLALALQARGLGVEGAHEDHVAVHRAQRRTVEGCGAGAVLGVLDALAAGGEQLHQAVVGEWSVLGHECLLVVCSAQVLRTYVSVGYGTVGCTGTDLHHPRPPRCTTPHPPPLNTEFGAPARVRTSGCANSPQSTELAGLGVGSASCQGLADLAEQEGGVAEVGGHDPDDPPASGLHSLLPALLGEDRLAGGTAGLVLGDAVVLEDHASVGPAEVSPEGAAGRLDPDLGLGARQASKEHLEAEPGLARRLRAVVGGVKDPTGGDHPAASG